MSISFIGHIWEDHYAMMQGKGREAFQKEYVLPGGVWWLAEVLKKCGVEGISNLPIPPAIRKEHYRCTEACIPDGKSNSITNMLAYSGHMEGDCFLAQDPSGLLVVYDDGLGSPIPYAKQDNMLLWISRMRIPGADTVSKFPKNSAILLDAGLLRQSGALISYQISWERTAMDTVWQLTNNPLFRHLLTVGEVIVAYAEEGFLVLQLENARLKSADLYLASGDMEGAARSKLPGEHPASWQMISASCALAGVRNGFPIIPGAFPSAKEAVSQGCLFYVSGQGIDTAALILSKDHPLRKFALPQQTGDSTADAGFYRILDHFSGVTLDKLAEQIILHGMSAVAGIPCITFGKLTSIDRGEIEAFMNIRNLINEYSSSNETRPLCIAVFGSPGSGKSFGVTQIAENILPNKVQKIEFNISQFSKKSDLCGALHKVRDLALGGKLPLVFFDEFDTDFEGQKLGWLKSFLMPMQDGRFLEGESEHPIGKCIFVFAGGTCASDSQFCTPLAKTATEDERKAFVDVKGPDFVSRLRGTLNVLGPNRAGDNDQSFLLRRALLLRSLCERKLKGCMTGSALNVDGNIVNALLLVPYYRYGARSMEALIDMSRTSGKEKWEAASLPVRAQLSLHVDADAFMRLLLRDVTLGCYREKLACQIHENYCMLQAEQKNTKSELASLEWEALSSEDKETNRAQADDIINKLGRFGYGFDAGDSFYPSISTFSDDKLEEMSKAEHQRWMKQKISQGWTYAPGNKDAAKHTSPYLVDWDELSEPVKELDRDAVRKIIPLLEKIGLRVYKRE